MSMSVGVYSTIPSLDTPQQELLYVYICYQPYLLLPHDERYGFYRVLNRSGYPWRARTSLQYLRENVDDFYASPQNNKFQISPTQPHPAFWLLPADMVCLVDMWDSS